MAASQPLETERVHGTMTSPDQSKGGRSRDEVLAGEYVLGVLSFKDRRVVEERMRRDRQFAAIVSRWETNLSAFNDDYDVVSPGQETFKQIEARLFGEPEAVAVPSRGLWTSSISRRKRFAHSSRFSQRKASISSAGAHPRQQAVPRTRTLVRFQSHPAEQLACSGPRTRAGGFRCRLKPSR